MIEKTAHRLSLYRGGRLLKTYAVALGPNARDPKEKEGDGRTPEGTYVIDSRKQDGAFHGALHILYPNDEDRRRARRLRVAPGGGQCEVRVQEALVVPGVVPIASPKRSALSCRSRLCFLVVIALGATDCGGAGTAPTSPGGGPTAGASEVLAVDVSCPTSLLIGERGPCVAVARLRSGQMPIVSFESIWSSNPPEVVAVDTLGVVHGRSAGQASVSVSYQGRQASAIVAVTEEDGLRIASGQAHQGDFRPGSTVTMWLQGYYSVASAASGRLHLQISDQIRTISTTVPLTVAKGGDAFLLSSTFVVPQDSSEVCRSAVLEIGSLTIVEPRSNESGLWCIPVRR